MFHYPSNCYGIPSIAQCDLASFQDPPEEAADHRRGSEYKTGRSSSIGAVDSTLQDDTSEIDDDDEDKEEASFILPFADVNSWPLLQKIQLILRTNTVWVKEFCSKKVITDCGTNMESAQLSAAKLVPTGPDVSLIGRCILLG